MEVKWKSAQQDFEFRDFFFGNGTKLCSKWGLNVIQLLFKIKSDVYVSFLVPGGKHYKSLTPASEWDL